MIYKIKKILQKKKIKGLKLGSGSRLNLGIIFRNPQNIIIGNNTYINGGMLSAGKNSKIIIGNDCLISYNVHIRTESHNYIQKDVLIREQGEFEKDINIEDDVWIGYGAQIMPGITIHKGAVVAAGSIVTKDVNEYSVVAGVPAKEIKKRI